MSRDLRIGLLTPSFSFAGEVDVPAVRLLVNRLAGDIEVSVIPVRYPPVAGWESRRGIEVLSPGGGGRSFRSLLLRSLATLRREHQRRPFDALHAVWLFEPGLIGVIAGRILRVPVVCSIGGAELAAVREIDYGGALSRRGQMIARAVLAGATRVTGGSTYVLEQARSFGAAEGKLSLVPLPVDIDLFSRGGPNRSDPSSPGPRILHVGSLLPVKDQVGLVDVFHRIVQQHPHARLTLVGEDPVGYQSSVERRAHELEVDAAVTFKGHMPQRALVDEFRAADLFIFPSRHESQGIAPLEALACGVPVVGTAVGAIRDLAPEGAIAVERGDVEALACACCDVIEHPELARRLAGRGEAIVRRSFGSATVAGEFISIYRDLAKDR